MTKWHRLFILYWFVDSCSGAIGPRNECRRNTHIFRIQSEKVVFVLSFSWNWFRACFCIVCQISNRLDFHSNEHIPENMLKFEIEKELFWKWKENLFEYQMPVELLFSFKSQRKWCDIKRNLTAYFEISKYSSVFYFTRCTSHKAKFENS